MYLQIVFLSVDDQMTRLYCKGDPCYLPVDKSDLTLLFLLCLRGMIPYPGVVWPAL